MRTIRLTESQINYIKSVLKEEGEINIQAKENQNGNVDGTTLRMQAQDVKRRMPGDDGNVNIVAPVNSVTECYTKKQVQEAKLRKMIAESTCYTKKSLRK